MQLFDIPESSSDTWGQPAQTPTLLGEFWADIVPLKGEEMLNVRQIWPTATHTVYLRWLGSSIPVTSDNPNGAILPRMAFKALNGNAILHIVSAINVEYRNRQWKITCEEKIGATA